MKTADLVMLPLVRTLAFVAGTAASASVSAGASWTLDAGVSRVAVDGVRTFAVPPRKLATNETSQVGAGWLRVGREIGDAFNVGFGYTAYGTLRASGFSPNSDIFDQSHLSFQVIVPLEIANRVQEWTLDGRYRWQWTPRLALEAGPTLSYFRSRATLGSSYLGGTINGPLQRIYNQIATYTSDDLRLGGAAALKIRFSARWEGQVGYRFAAMPQLQLHHVFAGAGWQF